MWDNPYRASDQSPPTGTAPAFSSNPFQGRMPTSPSTNYFALNATATYKMPQHTRVTAYVSRGFLTDAANTVIIPQTINGVLLAQPGIATLDRTSVNGKGDTKTFNLTFVSKPKDIVDVTAQATLLPLRQHDARLRERDPAGGRTTPPSRRCRVHRKPRRSASSARRSTSTGVS